MVILMKKDINSYINKEYKIYIFKENEIAENELKEKIRQRASNIKSMVFINDLGMNIERKFIPYYLLESDNNNYNYFLKKDNLNIASEIMASAIFVDPNLIKNRLYNNKILYEYLDFDETISFDKLYLNEYDCNSFELGFKYILEQKAIDKICEYNKIKYNDKGYKIEVDLYNLNYKRKCIYLEEIYEINIPYLLKGKNVNYKIIYSLVRNDFISFNYPYNNNYLEFLKLNKSILKKLPYGLDKLYYNDYYEAYLDSKKEISKYRLKSKIKSFANSSEEEVAKRYSKMGYFIFKNKKYLSIALKKENYLDFEDELYTLLMLSKVSGEANYRLSEFARLYMLSNVKRARELWLRYLKASTDLNYDLAIEKLYEYYHSGAFKDEMMANYLLTKMKK